jgi:hypothetical protein
MYLMKHICNERETLSVLVRIGDIGGGKVEIFAIIDQN